jgi:Derlin-2/3
MSEIQNFLKKIPPVTKYYLASVFVTTFLISYPIVKIIPYMIMEYEMAVYKFQIWRFITNFFIVGKFSFNFLFFLMMTYQTLIAFENRAIAQRKYSELVMMLFYICFFLLLINFILQYKVYLSMELLFAMIYIDSKRDPEKPVSLWGFRMKSKLI